MCTRRQEFDSMEEEICFGLLSPRDYPKLLYKWREEGAAAFKMNQKQLCLSECRVPEGLSGLLMDKGVLKAGNVKSVWISGQELLTFAITEHLLCMPIGRA